MTEYDRTNTFALFVNDKKGNDKAPDRSGTLNVDGVEYFIDGWLKEGKRGTFLSGRIKLKHGTAEPAKAAARSAAPVNDEGPESIPF